MTCKIGPPIGTLAPCTQGGSVHTIDWDNKDAFCWGCEAGIICLVDGRNKVTGSALIADEEDGWLLILRNPFSLN